MDWMSIIYFTTASLLLTLAPGPDILFVAAQSVTHGRKAGIVTALGLCTGLTVHTLAAAFGVSAVVYQSAAAFQAVKYAGALYLLYLAWQAWKESGHAPGLGPAPKLRLPALYRRGILMNVLNPKVSLFFLALLPQFVTAEAGNVPLQMVMLGLIFMVQAIAVFSVVAMLAGTIGSRMPAGPRVNRWIGKGKAALFAAIGIRLALAGGEK